MITRSKSVINIFVLRLLSQQEVTHLGDEEYQSSPASSVHPGDSTSNMLNKLGLKDLIR